MSKSIKGKVQLSTYDEILKASSGNIANEITEIELKQLYSFKDHPFRVVDDEKMEELIESIQDKGILSPIIVRPREKGGFEIISGHRRVHACKRLCYQRIPAIIKEMNDDDAIILMVDANLQRESILPSERAFSLQMKMDALKRQGKRNDLTSDQVEPKLTAERIGEKEKMSAAQVKRYICLTKLNKNLLEMVDSGQIGFVPAVIVSFIGKDEQEWIHSMLDESGRKLSLKQAELLRSEYDSKTLTMRKVYDILIGKNKRLRKVTLTEAVLKEFFPQEMDSKEIREVIIQLLMERKGGSD